VALCRAPELYDEHYDEKADVYRWVMLMAVAVIDC